MGVPSTSTAAALLSRTAALVPRLAALAQATESARRVSPEVYDALSDAGLFRMAAPAKYGGDEVDFQTQCDVLAEVARACPATSWVATILSAMAWLVGTFPDEAQEEIFASRDPRISGVFSPTGTAVPRDGGVVVNGRWGFNTGGHGSDWTILSAVHAGEAAQGGGIPLCVIARSHDLTRLDDWHASGMAGTGSNTIVAENLFIPHHRCQPLPNMLEARYPTTRHNAAHPYFNLPLASVLIVNAGGTPLGIARGAMEAFFARLPGRPITYTTYANQVEAPITHLQVGEASLLTDSATAHIGLAASILDQPRAGGFSVAERVHSRTHVAYATGLARQAVDILFHASGASAIQAHVPIQRFQRDMQALANHAIMHAPTGLELHGRVLCGLPPNTPLY